MISGLGLLNDSFESSTQRSTRDLGELINHQSALRGAGTTKPHLIQAKYEVPISLSLSYTDCHIDSSNCFMNMTLYQSPYSPRINPYINSHIDSHTFVSATLIPLTENCYNAQAYSRGKKNIRYYFSSLKIPIYLKANIITLKL